MAMLKKYILSTLILFSVFVLLSFYVVSNKKTLVSIEGNQFLINKELTYKGQYWNNHKVEGLLMNSRMVQGVFDDLNPETKKNFKYPDTKTWDANRNTEEFIANMESWYNHGMLAFTLNLQGGSPMGYGNNGWVNSTFDPKGNLRPEYMERLELILDKADNLGLVVILGYFYFGQDEHLENEAAVINAVDKFTQWLLIKNYRNVIVEVANECDIYYDHEILKPERIGELIKRIKVQASAKHPLLVSTSFSGGKLPTEDLLDQLDFVLLHGNGVDDPSGITDMVKRTRRLSGYNNKPILFNEDDHFKFEQDTNNMTMSLMNYASWGYFDFRHEGESFENGFQSIPADWAISSDRKKAFFNKLKEITKN